MIRFFTICVFLCMGSQSNAATIDDSIVYIECLNADDQIVSRGSGVVVSEEGHVLSARHVLIPKDIAVASCRGSIGIADSNNTSRLVLAPAQTDLGFDAAIARFSKTNEYVPLQYCEFDDATIRTRILISGFPGGTKTGKPSFRAGIISTAYIDPKGMVETDGLSTAGMSGGPVVSEDGEQLIGIISGVDYNQRSEPTFYGITPISEFANLFQHLGGTGKSCGNAGADEQQALLDELVALKDELARARNPFVEVSRLAQSHVVAINCGEGTGADQSFVGTGVIVSGEGHVLTAGFVAEEGQRCSANLGSRQINKPLRLSERTRSNKGGVILQISPTDWANISDLSEGHELKYKSVSDVELGTEIATIGFHGLNEVGLPTFRRGYLSTNFPSTDGTIEAAVGSAPGMSGAPIFDADSNVIGILIGESLSSNFTTLLSSDYLAQEFDAFIKLQE